MVIAAQPLAAMDTALVQQVRDIEQISASPDGRRVAVVLARSAVDGGGSDMWIATANGTAPKRLASISTTIGERVSDPSWSADGSELFFRDENPSAVVLQRWRDDEGQALLLVRQADGGINAEWRPIGPTPQAISVERYALSPDGRLLAIIVAGRTAPGGTRPSGDHTEIGDSRDPNDELVLIERDSTIPPRVYPLRGRASSLDWKADGRHLAIVSGSDDDRRGPAHGIWTLNADRGDIQAVAGIAPSISEAVWTAKGFAYLARCTEDAPPDCRALFTRDAGSGKVAELTRGIDGSVADGIAVEQGGTAVILTVMIGVGQRPARIDLQGKISWLYSPAPVVSAVATTKQGALAMIASGPDIDRSVFLASPSDHMPKQVLLPALHPNAWIAATPKVIRWRSGGRMIDGMVAMPDSHLNKVPLVTWVHGGPYAAFQDRRYNLVDLLTSHGIAVFMPNPRGSKGRGATFARANRGDLGGGDLRDVKTGIAAVARSFPVNPHLMAMIGYSYGGTMACFAAGRTSLFNAFVAGSPVVDQVSEFGTEDSSFDDRWYFNDPRANRASAWRQSPLSTARHARAPMLLFEGDADTVDPPSQALQMYNALKDAGISPAYVLYPQETHASLAAAFGASPIGKSRHATDVVDRMLDFLEAGLNLSRAKTRSEPEGDGGVETYR